MDIKNKPTLAEKQDFWAEQLPNFEAKYWLPSHFELLEFDMEGGNYEVRDVLPEHYSEDDATEIWHRVNTGWAMWKKAINFTKAQKVSSVVVGFDEWFRNRHEKTGLYEQALWGEDDATYIRHEMRKAFQAGLKENKVIPEGFVLVPKEPTEEMIRMGDLAFAYDECVDARKIYKAMIEAQEQSHEK